MARPTNPYKKYIKLLLNKHAEHKLLIERVTDCYYIVDTVSLVKVPYFIYDECFRKESNLFVELKNGECVTYKAGSIEPETEDCGKFAELFKNTIAMNDVDLLPVLFEDGSKDNVRIAVADDHITCFNDAYISAIKSFAGSFKVGGRYNPIIYDDLVIGAMIMPIRNNKVATVMDRVRKAILYY